MAAPVGKAEPGCRSGSLPAMARLRLAAALALALSAIPLAASTAGERGAQALDDVFRPEELTLAAGTTVTWVNAGRNPHTVTADDGAFDSGDMAPGATFSHTFDRPGTFPFYCRYHGAPGGLGMAGLVVVGGAEVEGPGETEEPPALGTGRTIRVPRDRSTIQRAVDAARPGDLVLVSPGIYRESVRVTTPYLTIRGTDRNGVILDGRFRRPNGIHVLEADGVTVENMTARHFTLNGFYWIGVEGYRGSYLTAYNNGDYGVYAFDSVRGQFDHSYASGHPDAGFYIGQCRPCHAVITDVVAERNALGYSGTNASGDLVIAGSEWRLNMAGIVPNTLDSELLPPQGQITIVGNWVHDNDNADAPAKPIAHPAFGTGILLAGTRGNVVERNLVEEHDRYGIAVLPNLDANLWLSGGNRVRDNVVRDSGMADLALGAPAEGGNCFSGNRAGSTLPVGLQLVAGCGFRASGGGGGDLGVTSTLLGRYAEAEGGRFGFGDWRTQPAPPPQPQMPRAATAPPGPAVEVPNPIDTQTIPVPAGGGGAAGNREVTVLGISVAASSWWALLISVYGYVLPLVLYAAWVSVAAWDLVRRADLSAGGRAGWLVAILLVPVLGPVAYFAAGRSPIPASMRATLVAGGIIAYVLFAALSFVVASS